MANLNSKPCRICFIIRLFIFAMMALLIIALLAKEKMHHFSFITSTNVAIVIITFGLISFVVKYFLWKREAKQKSSDFLQNE